MSSYSTEALSSGPSAGTDPTLVPSQYPKSLFGVALPQTTGAAGSQGAVPASGGVPVDYTSVTGDPHDRPSVLQQLGGPGDSTTLANQSVEGISGLGPDFISHSGAGSGRVSTPHHPNAGTGTGGGA